MKGRPCDAAAEQGEVTGQLRLGLSYLHGLGVVSHFSAQLYPSQHTADVPRPCKY